MDPGAEQVGGSGADDGGGVTWPQPAGPLLRPGALAPTSGADVMEHGPRKQVGVTADHNLPSARTGQGAPEQACKQRGRRQDGGGRSVAWRYMHSSGASAAAAAGKHSSGSSSKMHAQQQQKLVSRAARVPTDVGRVVLREEPL